MAVIFCASKHLIVAQWKKLLTCKDTYIAKSQKDLLTQLSKDQIAPIVFIEERLYADQTPALIASLRASYSWARLLVLSHSPTFHGAQAMLGFGAHGYGNVYMGKAWLNDAYMSLIEGENWIFPLQETPPKQVQAVGKIIHLDGNMVDEFNQPLKLGDGLRTYQKALLLDGKAVVAFDHGVNIELQGREPIMVDESVFRPQPIEPLEVLPPVETTPVNQRPFYINLGAQSLIAPMSDELEISPSKYTPVCPFVIEESNGSLNFAQDLETPHNISLRLNGPIEAYELIHSSALQCVLINDINNQFEGASIVYEPIKTIFFSNASVALLGVPPRQEYANAFGIKLSWDEVGDEVLETASIEVKGGRQGVDYVLFDRQLVPESLHFTYSLDEDTMGIQFEGRASRQSYKDLLQTLTHECTHSSSANPLHVKIAVGTKEKTYILFDGPIDTHGNTQ
jgi:hypothetical protein